MDQQLASSQWNPLSDDEFFQTSNYNQGEPNQALNHEKGNDTFKQEEPLSSLTQQFSDFSFLFLSYPVDQIRIAEVIVDLNKNLDHFLNDNIKSILSLARTATTNQDFQNIIRVLKIVLKRRLFASKEIIVLVKHCFLIRGLIELLDRFPNSVKLRFCRTLLSLDENHYNSPYTSTQIIQEIQMISKSIPQKNDQIKEQNQYLFEEDVTNQNEKSPLAVLYTKDIMKTSILAAIKQNIPFSLGIIISLMPFVSEKIIRQAIDESQVIKKLEENFGLICNLPKNDIQLIMKHSSFYLQDSSFETKLQFMKLQMKMASELFQASSIEKKIWALSIINEKIKLIKIGYKNYPLDVDEFLDWIEKNRIYENVVQFNVHSEIINRSNQLLRFLYQNEKISAVEIEQIITLALKSQSDTITAFAHNFLVFLEYKDLEITFQFLAKKAENQKHINNTFIALLQSVINSHKISNKQKNSKKKRSNSASRADQKKKNKSNKASNIDLFDDRKRQKNQQKMIEIQQNIIGQPTELALKIFKFIITHVEEYPLISTLVKLINNQPAIFNQVPNFIISSIRQNKPSSIQLLDSILKLSFPIPKDNGLWTRHQLISWLANEGLIEYLISGLAVNRFQKSINERINLLILVARHYNKPFEIAHVQFLWKILGLRATDEKQRQQFFVFIKDCLTKSNNMLFSQDSIHYIYIQILLKLHSQWFSLKVYQCLQMFFIRLNQDCKLIIHSSSNSSNGTYQLMDTELIGVKKFWYIYFRGEDAKVIKKCREFLCRLITKFQYSDKIGSTIKEQYISIIMSSMKSSFQLISTSKDQLKAEYTQIQRCLDILTKLIQDMDGINITGEKIQGGQEWTININNSIADSMPPKKFTMKVNANSTLRSLRQQIAAKINPPKHEGQIKLMTRGQYLKGENMTIKQLKLLNKQTFTVELNQQLLPSNESTLNQNTFQMLKMMFPNHSEQLLKYVMMKRLGEDEQAIAEVLLDQETVNLYIKEIQGSKVVSKHLSQLLVSNTQIFQIFFNVLSLHSQEHSDLIWKIISNLPSNFHYIFQIKDTILNTHDWNEVFSFSSSDLFKTLYNLQLLRNILTGAVHQSITKEQQTELTNKLVETGGFEHIFKYLKIIMTNWKGSLIEAKLLSHLIQVIKIYLKPHLTQIVKQPLDFMFKEVMNYKKHLLELGNYQIRHIITQILSPDQTNTITSKSWKSFSFKGQSASSNATPGFGSPNNSGRNSPHSEAPKRQKQEDNISDISISKSINNSKNSRKKRSMIERSFETKMRQNINLQLNLQHLVNVTELVQLIFKNLQTIIYNPTLLQHQDINIMSQQLFEILYPVLLINNSYSLFFNDNDMVQTIGRGMSQINRQDFRVKLVYLVFLLCVIEEEDKLIVEDDDELIMTEAKKLKPRIFFLKALIPFFQSQSTLHQTYFLCISKLISQIDPNDLKQFFDAKILVNEMIKRINQRPDVQKLDNQVEDYTLNGLLLLLRTLLEKYQYLKQQCNVLIIQLIQYLFYIPTSLDENIQIVNYPKCKRKTTRRRCFDLLIELCKNSKQSKQNLSEMLVEYSKNLHLKQYYDSVVLKTQKYSGLKNLGATCYINSLLQQFHKNSQLKYLLTNPDVININPSHPLHELAYLFSSLSISLMSTINPINFIKTVRFHGNQQINPKIQQDVNQFFMAFVDLMERNQAKDILQSCLMGQICNQITCCEEDQALKFVKKHSEQFYTITLDIKGKKNLYEALQFFVKGDLLDGDNKYYSSQLDRKVKAVKRSYLKSLPNCLVFTLKRFQFDYNSMLRYKLNDYFQFPFELDLLKYTEQVLSDEIQHMHESNYFKYKLVGVLVHSGTAESGHYYSYIREGDKWYEYNDSLVTQFNINNLRAECFGGQNVRGHDFDNRSRNAYLLFYERIVPLQTLYSQKLKSSHDKEQYKISGPYAQLVWKQNFKFLKSRLIYDADFIKFLQQIKSEGTQSLLQDIQGKPNQKCFIQFQNNDLDIANPDIILAKEGLDNSQENIMKEINFDAQDVEVPLMHRQDSNDEGHFWGI